MNTKTHILITAAITLLAVSAVGQSGGTYDVVWSTTDAGGQSSGGPYTVHGVAGQPDAGEMSGGTYTVHGGFVGSGETATAIGDAHTETPSQSRLYPNVPNPFNPATTARFDLAEGEHVRLAVYDVGGRLIRTLVDEPLPAGTHTARWDGTNSSGETVASGVYLLVIRAGAFREVTKITLLK